MSLFSIVRTGEEPPVDSPSDRELSIAELSISVKYEAGQFHETIAEASAAIQHHPGHAPFYFMRAIAREDLFDWDGAISDYNEYLRIEPDQHNALFRIGLCYQHSKRTKEALGYFDRAVQHYENTGTPLTKILSELAVESGKPSTGKSWFTIPKANVLNNRAVLRAQVGNVQGAYEDVTEAIELDPSYAKPYRVRGILLVQRGDVEQGKHDLRKAVSLGDAQCAALLVKLGG